MTAAVTALPRFHIRPARGWLNDPNGIVHHDGRWHVFFQHNPVAPVHDLIHWGHVSSEDLVDWREHPVAFGPTPQGPDSFGCWSGVFVTGLDRPAVAYSGIIDATCASTVCLRWGSADLDSWSEPIVVADTPAGVGVRIMRDPFLFTWRGRRWAILGAGLDDLSAAVLLYSVDDVTAWQFEGVWIAHSAALDAGGVADIWECPQILETPGGPVLVLSLQYEGVLGDVIVASGELIDREGKPHFEVGDVSLLDRGNSFYAPQLVADGDRPLMFGWVRQVNLFGPDDVVAGCMTLPRRIEVIDGVVRVSVDPAVDALLTGTPVDLGPGAHELPAAVHVELSGSSAPDGWRLDQGESNPGESNPGTSNLGDGAGLADGTRIWLDADIAEIYPGDGSVPLTFRGDAIPWRLVVPQGASARVRQLALPT